MVKEREQEKGSSITNVPDAQPHWWPINSGETGARARAAVDDEEKEVKPTLALAAHLSAWPEGEEAKAALVKWCLDEGVPPPSQSSSEIHRPSRLNRTWKAATIL